MRIKKMIINMIQEALPCQNYSKCIMNSMEKNNTFKLTAVTAVMILLKMHLNMFNFVVSSVCN